MESSHLTNMEQNPFYRNIQHVNNLNDVNDINPPVNGFNRLNILSKDSKSSFNNMIMSNNSLSLKEQINSVNSNKNKVEIVCPHCEEHLGHTDLNTNNNSQNTTFKEANPIECSKCKKTFTFTICVHCTRGIFFKGKCFKEGVNIKCPYKNCEKYFNKTVCGHCKAPIVSNSQQQEGRLIQCLNCSDQSAYFDCPECGERIVKGPQSFSNKYTEGSIIKCTKCKVNFQKVSCAHCMKRLAFITRENSKDKMYIEGQKVNCPYEECKKAFNKVYCPHCFLPNIFTKGGLLQGNTIDCMYKNCGKSFAKVFCPKCSRINVLKEGKYIEGNEIICSFNDCNSRFNFVYCPHCVRVSIWKNGGYIHGQLTTCAYTDCQKTFCKTYCPHCKKNYVIKEGSFIYGKTYKCENERCFKDFSNFICGECKVWETSKEKYSEGSNVWCCKNCPQPFLNFRCPHCLGIILDKGAKYKFGQTVICPYQNCGMRFNYLYCIFCRRGIYYKNNNYVEGQIVVCPFMDCANKFVFVYCGECSRPLQFNSIDQNLINEQIKCAYKDCKSLFIPESLNKSYFTPLSNFYPLQPTKFEFAEPVKDYVEFSMDKSFIDLRLYIYSKFQDYLDEQQKDKATKRNNIILMYLDCVVCYDAERQSVFVPCGHKACCYSCAEKVMTKSKKCPVCIKVSTEVLKKIYDV